MTGVLPGVADGTRTHDDQNHNLGLYQLSYSHREGRDYRTRPKVCFGVQLAGADAAATISSTLGSNLTPLRRFKAS
jgi:hypothetical protein